MRILRCAFLKKIAKQEADGNLTATEADDLTAMAEAFLDSLGC